VQTFADFVRHSEMLVKAVRSMESRDFVCLCTNAARAGYFDGDLFRDIWETSRQLTLDGKLDLDQMLEVCTSLHELNAYDEETFSAAAKMAKPKITQMPSKQRLLWIDLYNAVGHQRDHGFIDSLKSLLGTESAPREVGSDGKQPCKDFKRHGSCRYGKKCHFSHEAGLEVHTTCNRVMLNSHQILQKDTYQASRSTHYQGTRY